MRKVLRIDAPSSGARHVWRPFGGLMLAVLSLGLAWAPATVRATPPTPLEMTITLTGPRVLNSSKYVADKWIFTQTTVSKVTGDVEGTYIYEMRAVIDLPTFTGTARLTGTFEGTVYGEPGTVVIEASATIDGATGTQTCQWHAGHGTGDLAGLHMEGEGGGPIGGPIEMWGQAHFDP